MTPQQKAAQTRLDRAQLNALREEQDELRAAVRVQYELTVRLLRVLAPVVREASQRPQLTAVDGGGRRSRRRRPVLGVVGGGRP